MDTYSLSMKAAVIDTVHRFFILTDQRDWDGLQDVFAPEVLFDMTSLAGGEPDTLTSRQITDAWDEGLKDVAQIHHLVGNVLVQVAGGQADVFCYGLATHYRPGAEGRKVTTFAGSYDLHLVLTESGWRVDRFRYNSKYVD